MAVASPLRHSRLPGAARSVGALVAIAVHGMAGVALLGYQPARTVAFAAPPIMVDFVTLPKAEPEPQPPAEIVPPAPKPPPEPKPKPVAKPKPKPVAKSKPAVTSKRVVKPQPRAPEPAPVLAAPVEAPSPVAITAPPPDPQPEAQPPTPPPVAVAPPPAPVVPVTPPMFNADYLRNPPPAYPALSRRVGEEGRVLLRVLVSAEGAAQEVEVRTSSGHARLDQAAREAVQRWKFVPARRGERAVAAWVLVPISFRLEG